MIAELFYPKELKEIIADLRAKDDLNEEALERMNGFIYKRLMVYFLLSFVLAVPIFYLEDFVSKTFMLACVLTIAYGFFQEIKPFLRLYPRLYSEGKSVNGVVLKVYLYGVYGAVSSRKVEYIYELGGQKYKTVTSKIPNIINLSSLKKNSEILIYLDRKNSNKSILYTPSLYSLFNLKKET